MKNVVQDVQIDQNLLFRSKMLSSLKDMQMTPTKIQGTPTTTGWGELPSETGRECSWEIFVLTPKRY